MRRNNLEGKDIEKRNYWYEISHYIFNNNRKTIPSLAALISYTTGVTALYGKQGIASTNYYFLATNLALFLFNFPKHEILRIDYAELINLINKVNNQVSTSLSLEDQETNNDIKDSDIESEIEKHDSNPELTNALGALNNVKDIYAAKKLINHVRIPGLIAQFIIIGLTHYLLESDLHTDPAKKQNSFDNQLHYLNIALPLTAFICYFIANFPAERLFPNSKITTTKKQELDCAINFLKTHDTKTKIKELDHIKKIKELDHIKKINDNEYQTDNDHSYLTNSAIILLLVATLIPAARSTTYIANNLLEDDEQKTVQSLVLFFSFFLSSNSIFTNILRLNKVIETKESQLEQVEQFLKKDQLEGLNKARTQYNNAINKDISLKSAANLTQILAVYPNIFYRAEAIANFPNLAENSQIILQYFIFCSAVASSGLNLYSYMVQNEFVTSSQKRLQTEIEANTYTELINVTEDTEGKEKVILICNNIS